ncbi:MAG: hypothetical protein ACE5GN_02545, partial [Waddliaceae bacterium]
GSAHVHTLPRTVWIQLSEDGKTVRIQFYGKHYKSGTYKDVKESETIVITLSNGSNKPKRRENTVLVRTRDTQEDKSGKRATQAEIRESQEDDLEMVNNGIQTIKHLFPPEELERDSNLKFCGIPKTIRKHQGKNRKKFEWEEVRFSNDFSEVCKTGQVKCDTAGTIVTEFRTNDKFRIAEFLTYTVEQIHLKGKVHRDVKPINILVHYNEARQCPEGFLTDYDLITDFGSNETKSEYEYWDLCSEKGFVLPTADIFGVAMCLGSSIFGAKYPEILSSARHHYDIREIESTINEFHGKYINLKIVPLYKDINTSSLLRKQLRDYLQWVSNRAIRDGRPVPDIDEIKEVLDSIIKANPEKETSILTILADCYAAQELSQLLFEIHKADLDLFTFIMKDPKGKDLALALGNESVSLEDKLEMIQALYVKFPIFKEFRGRLKNIRTNWEH